MSYRPQIQTFVIHHHYYGAPLTGGKSGGAYTNPGISGKSGHPYMNPGLVHPEKIGHAYMSPALMGMPFGYSTPRPKGKA